MCFLSLHIPSTGIVAAISPAAQALPPCLQALPQPFASDASDANVTPLPRSQPRLTRSKRPGDVPGTERTLKTEKKKKGGGEERRFRSRHRGVRGPWTMDHARGHVHP